MKKTITKILLTSIILLGFGSINQTNANYNKNNIKIILNNYINNYEIKYGKEKTVFLLKKVGIKIRKILDNEKTYK